VRSCTPRATQPPPPRYRALVLVAAFGGLRWGELVGLRRQRVDLAAAIAGELNRLIRGG
jgi:integrase